MRSAMPLSPEWLRTTTREEHPPRPSAARRNDAVTRNERNTSKGGTRSWRKRWLGVRLCGAQSVRAADDGTCVACVGRACTVAVCWRA